MRMELVNIHMALKTFASHDWIVKNFTIPYPASRPYGTIVPILAQAALCTSITVTVIVTPYATLVRTE